MSAVLFVILGICLFWGAKICKRKEWNEDVLSFAQTKSFLGFCALIIILHHCSHKTCAPWLIPFRIVHGLDFFVFAGYLCVAVFFFCSGYGMYTAFSQKEGFFKGYHKRIIKILIPAVVMWLAFYFVEKSKGMWIEKPIWINTYSYIWYIPALLYLYLIFYLSFHLIKNDKIRVATVIAGTFVYFVFSMFFSPGTWWYNTHHLFVAGIITARHKEKIISFFKKGYPFWVVISFVITYVGFVASNYYYPVMIALGFKADELSHFITELTGQVISAFSFVVFVMLIGMKIKVGNKFLLFLGSFTLEIYLVHPMFVELFAYAFIQDSARSLYHIRNPFLYALVVSVIALPLAFILNRVTGMIVNGKSKGSKNINLESKG
ncbi:MAG: acyltransferase [Lachnospiraceae bacterium]|nr:acyltransferase [Lachnospiraceae bacterium]